MSIHRRHSFIDQQPMDIKRLQRICQQVDYQIHLLDQHNHQISIAQVLDQCDLTIAKTIDRIQIRQHRIVAEIQVQAKNQFKIYEKIPPMTERAIRQFSKQILAQKFGYQTVTINLSDKDRQILTNLKLETIKNHELPITVDELFLLSHLRRQFKSERKEV